MRVLQLEADSVAASAMQRSFETRAFIVDARLTVARGLEALAQRAYDVVVVDLRLPDGSGADLCRSLRARGDQTPVVVLGLAMTERELVAAYGAGASLCLRKPVSADELVAHVEAITRGGTLKTIALASAVLHVQESRLVLPDGSSHPLSGHECRLCLELARHPGAVIERDDLISAIWGDVDPNGNDLDVLVFRIRKKLGALASLVHTERGRGYRLLPDHPAKASGVHPVVRSARAAKTSARRAS